MKSLGLEYFTDTYLTTFGLLIFFGLFVLILVLQVKSYHSEKIKYFEKLPFEGDQHELR